MVGQFFTMLFAKLASIVTWFGKLAVAVFASGWDFACDAFCWPFDQITDILVSAVQSLDLSGLQQQVGSWGSLPADVINVLGLLGVGQASAIIISAITIRLTLQLIPFVRLGS